MIRYLVVVIAALLLIIVLEIAGVIHLHPCATCPTCPDGVMLPKPQSGGSNLAVNGGETISQTEAIALMDEFKHKDCSPGSHTEPNPTQVFFTWDAISWMYLHKATDDNGFFIFIGEDAANQKRNLIMASGSEPTVNKIAFKDSDVAIKAKVVCPTTCWP